MTERVGGSIGQVGELGKIEDKVEMEKTEALEAIREAWSLAQLEELRVSYLGRKGVITQALRSLGELPPDLRPAVGKSINESRALIERSLEERKLVLAQQEKEMALKKEAVDVTLPGVPPAFGKRHPVTATFDELKEIFIGMGYEVVEGPEIELEYYNFEALNVPKYHPARDIQDTLYITDDILLRTQTSPMQIRVMQSRRPPIRVIVPGKVYRSDATDATHSAMFHQLEGFVVDNHITLGDLKGTLIAFARAVFGEDRKVRFRPSYFPFTEPSAEVDVSCGVCGGDGCRVCGGAGWLEILGSGMIHPKVLENVGYDPEEYSGFAFGMGVERIAMRKYGIEDIRLLFDNDMRFLRQF